MPWGFAFGLLIVGVIVCAFMIGISSVNEEDKVLKTKILETKIIGVVGTVNKQVCRETTFVVYYKDGTRDIVTESNGSMGYKMYLRHLEV